jgi:small-conductance mechanosensitive channel
MNRVIYIASVIAIVAFLFTAPSVFSQTDTTSQTNDSLNKLKLEDYNKKLAEIEQQRVSDSIKRAGLEEELNSLKTTDNLKKEELQNELQELNEKEEKRIAQKKARIDSLRLTAKGYPVNGFFNDTLFLVYNKLGSFSAKERAEAISKRIKKLKDHFFFTADSIKLIEAETTVDIVFEDEVIMSISENDAIWNNSSKMDLAKKYKQITADAVLKYKSETSLLTLAKEIGLALLVIIIVAGVIFYIRKFIRWTAELIKQQEGKSIKGIKIKSYTLFDSGQMVKVTTTANNVFKWIIIFLVIYIALPILFSIFPWTRNFADILLGYIINPVKKIANSIWNYLPNLFTIIVIIIVFRYVIRFIRFLKTEIESESLKIPGFYPDWANPTYQIIRILLFAFSFVLIFPYLPGSDSPVFQGVSVFLGFLFTFGSAGSLSNIIAGLVLTYMRLFNIGDRVKIGDDVVGDVIEKSMLVTRVRTIKNEIISIPNSTIMNSHTINYSSDAPEKGLIIHTTVTIGYDVPWRNMHQALIDAALKTELLLHNPKPYVLQTSLDDFYVSYQINAYTKDPNKQAIIYSDLHKNIQDVCNERGIEIMSPHYRSERDGNKSSIPENYLPKDYSAPPFKIKIEKDENKT